MAGSLWERFTLDPRTPQHQHLRASDADRDVAREHLLTAFSEGRLDEDEVDERTEQLGRTRTLGELVPLLQDVVVPAGLAPAPRRDVDLRAEAERRYRQQRQQALAAFLTPTLVCWFIWVVASVSQGSPQFPWPVFVMFSGVRWVQLLTSRDDTTAEIQQKLEKREEKRLASRSRRQDRELERRRRQDEQGA